MDVQRILRRQGELESRRANWETLWEEVARRVIPRSDDFRRSRTPGEPRTQWKWDAFPALALDRFAAAMEGGLTPRNARWHQLTTGDEHLDDEPGVKEYLEALNNTLWSSRYAPRSNFISQAHEHYLALGAFGTACMFVEGRPGGGIRYRERHLGDVFIATNKDGEVDTVHCKVELTARQAVQQFGAKAPEKARTAMDAGKPDTRFDFLHVVMPREEYDPSRLDNKGMPLTDLYICCDDQTVCRDGGYFEMPYIVSRYVLAPGEDYGRSAATTLLPDIKMLNEMRRDVIEAANLVVDPPVMLHDDAISEFAMTPGARNYGAVNDDGRQLAVPYQHGGDIGVGLELMADVRNQIDDGFLGVYYRVLLENPQMTATQALLIAQQQGQMTAPIAGRQHAEFLSPLIRRESGILFRQGKHPREVPEALAEHLQRTGEPLGVDYESPMVRQAKSGDAVAILRSFETLAPLSQIPGGEKVLQRIDLDAAARVVMEVNGVPASVIRDDEQMEAIEEQQAAQQALQAVLQGAPVAAETAKTLAEAQAVAGANPTVPA